MNMVIIGCANDGIWSLLNVIVPQQLITILSASTLQLYSLQLKFSTSHLFCTRRYVSWTLNLHFPHVQLLYSLTLLLFIPACFSCTCIISCTKIVVLTSCQNLSVFDFPEIDDHEAQSALIVILCISHSLVFSIIFYRPQLDQVWFDPTSHRLIISCIYKFA